MKKGKKSESKKLGFPTNHLTTLHQRLNHALNLCFRCSDNKEREWHANDVEMQRLVIRSISAFLDGISPETLHVPLVKECVSDMVGAMASILDSKNEAVLPLAAETAAKLFSILPGSMIHPHVARLSHPLSSLLSSNHDQVAVTSAAGLNLIVSNLSIKKEKEVWNILDKTGAVPQLVSNLRSFSDKVKPIEYFLEMCSLLSSIMRLWPPSRYPVWNDAKLMEVMKFFCSNPETNVKVAVLQLYSSLALCGSGAHKLLENGKDLVQTVQLCMGKSQPYTVRILAFKLAQHLMANKEGCLRVLSMSGEPLVKSITFALSDSRLHHSKVSNSEASLVLEACRLALITRWPGMHHSYLWKLRVDRILYNLLLHNFKDVMPLDQSLSVEGLIMMTRDILNANHIPNLQLYVWEIIGWLSAHCDDDFLLSKHRNEHYLSVLIAGACVAFGDSIGRKRLICHADLAYKYSSISSGKATMMMLYSPSKYIAFQARLVLSELFRLDIDEQLKHLKCFLNFVYIRDTSRMPDVYEMLISLMRLTCYSGIPQFFKQFVRNGGIKFLSAFLKWWLNNNAHITKITLSSHLHNIPKGQRCCISDNKDWEGEDPHLLLALWVLSEVIRECSSEGLMDIFSGQVNYSKEELIKDVMDISMGSTSAGVRWYCSYFLSFWEIYGFPNKLGKRIKSVFGDEDQSDISLVLRNGQLLNVHRVVLLVRCPFLLPPEHSSNKEITSNPDDLKASQAIHRCGRTKKEITLSAQVDEQALLKLLDFIYSGYLESEGDLIRKLKMLAKRCNVQPLLQLLCKERPKWGASFPNYDLSEALGPGGHKFTDVIMEAKSTLETEWVCSWCSLHAPHIHAHRVILCSSCDYMRALFQSGMLESHSEILKVPISWEALQKLVTWIYSNDLPKPLRGCLWDNMTVERRISELGPYIELCWLAEFWFLDDVQTECLNVVSSLLDSPEVSIKVIQLAADFSQWKLVDAAAKQIAPTFHKLRRSGSLDLLDEGLVEIIRVAAVRLSQE